MNETLIPVIVAVVAIVPALVTLWQTRRQAKITEDKLKAERRATEVKYASLISDSALDLLEPYREELRKLRKRVESLQKKVEEYQVESEEMFEKLSHYESTAMSQENEIAALRTRIDEYEQKFLSQSRVINELELRSESP